MKILEIHNKSTNNDGKVDIVLTPGDNPRQLSIADGYALAEARKLPGLCTKKFDADIITEGLDYNMIKPGSRLVIGDAIIEISLAGKRCYDECVIHKAGNSCPLPRNCAFARVITGGCIQSDMEISLS